MKSSLKILSNIFLKSNHTFTPQSRSLLSVKHLYSKPSNQHSCDCQRNDQLDLLTLNIAGYSKVICAPRVCHSFRSFSSGRTFIYSLGRKVKNFLQIFNTNMAESKVSSDKCVATEDDNSIVHSTVKPPDNIGMTQLDRSGFTKTYTVPTLKVSTENMAVTISRVKPFMLKLSHFKAIDDLPEDDPQHSTHKLFVLDPEKFGDFKQAPLHQRLKLPDVEYKNFKFGYDNWKYNDILKAVLPSDNEAVGGFSTIGHVIHLNLKDELLPYKHLIGQVILDKISSVKTVVNKTNTIDNTYRNFSMEVIAGEADLVTTAKEHGCAFKMDFSKVYWNSRLGTEHQRIVSSLVEGDIVYDMFAGVGPFAIPAAKKKKCRVLANDLNPESYKWMKENVQLNKAKNVSCYNMDAREFAKQIVKPDLVERWKMTEGLMPNYHIIMNLPALAVTFLDVFIHLMKDVDKNQLCSMKMPKVHCYCFTKSESGEADVKQQVEQMLGASINETNYQIKNVRNVAPNKEMYCASFTLPEAILFGQTECEEPKSKKPRVDSNVSNTSHN